MSPLCIGFNPDFAPFAWDDRGTPRGLVIDRLGPALAAAELTADYRPLALPDMAPALAAGTVDALAGVGVTADRAATMAFSKPLVETGGAWFVRKGIRWPDDAGLKAGTMPAPLRVVTPAAGPLAAHIRAHYPTLRLDTCRDYNDALAAVARGDADAAALNLHVGRARVDTAFADHIVPAAEPFLAVNLALAVAPGDPLGLLPRIDAHL